MIELPRLGMGTATLGVCRAIDDLQAEAAVRVALAGGICDFDTAPAFTVGTIPVIDGGWIN